MSSSPLAVARRPGNLYLAVVSFRRLLSLFVALAVMLVPAAMPAAAAAMTSSHSVAAAPPAGHCADMPEPAKQQAPDDCCLMTCVALPPTGGAAMAGMIAPAPLLHRRLTAGDHGLDPVLETPPPRFS